jgi:hypothetical protein
VVEGRDQPLARTNQRQARQTSSSLPRIFLGAPDRSPTRLETPARNDSVSCSSSAARAAHASTPRTRNRRHRAFMPCPSSERLRR